MTSTNSADDGLVTRKGLIGFGALVSAAAATFAAWPLGAPIALILGVAAGIGTASALHALIPKSWK